MKVTLRNMHLKSPIRRVEDLRGLRATVMGLGLNGGGLATARFLAERGAIVTVTDMKDEIALADSISALSGLSIRYVLGKHEIDDFAKADLVIKNPAVRSDSPFLLAARSIETDISLFLRFSAAPIIAITGSKGKSSVSSAIQHIFHSSGRCSFLGGNITVSPLTFLDRCKSDTPVVLELSSWQLADMRGLGVLKPLISVLTSIMPDHMNRYSSMDEYVADKRLIYRDQDWNCFTLCNRDETWGRSFASETKAKVLWYSREASAGFPGAWIDRDTKSLGYYSNTGHQEDAEIIVPEKLLVLGQHQRMNMLSAALACRVFGMDSQDISSSLASYPGVEHRLECFAVKNGISWYNDSAATIPQAVMAALDSFSSPVLLITGGTDKNIDFEPFSSMYARAKSIFLLNGTGTEKIISILKREGIPFHGPFEDFTPAIADAASCAKHGDSVLLSPGCTSFGMFANEFDRGRKFKEITKLLLGLC
jgi:UDP-N-acetylmuramoylalanine--D-glutamate ligase